ncbi:MULTISPECIES: hypothetical protein [Corynebacterium]|uniref:Uncharacterized protein n=1 Tax=Corynebacterium riegelii TaxID=156976 RepID=A0A0K1R9F0_9CORY|nr:MULTISPECIES: hypothetical protein [Corynebacterium]AKV58055.1 hypothetical protein AK829_01475 [Corynebacterium riegelii]OFT73893.1 hypothetical protein HMPREF3104_11385 [Corynebacterium sp. HMSC30G07]PLA13146.1 hypothetical protein CYJ48_06720 [Corynebacterium riegelii]
MDKDLVVRIVLVVVTVIAYLIADTLEFHNTVLAPIAVLTVAVIMFWPRVGDNAASTSKKPKA